MSLANVNVRVLY